MLKGKKFDAFALAPSGTNIANIEKMAEKRGTGMFVYEEKLYFCN